ncbi:hypothetical protein [Olsenella uli]|uniref:hypothetical protein n=1 Tax=Olsenella uli TaxID=133926 RepID=UPI00241C7DA8|nr:hypothetical protein [Olsenella uli]
MGRRLRHGRGGIGALVRVDRETDGALSYDLMTLVGVTLRDVPGTIGWDGLRDLYRHLGTDSATWRAQHPELAPYATAFGLAQMAGELVDGLAAVQYAIACAHRTKGAPRPRRPRLGRWPWRKADGTERHLGSGALPRRDFLAWYYDGD